MTPPRYSAIGAMLLATLIGCGEEEPSSTGETSQGGDSTSGSTHGSGGGAGVGGLAGTGGAASGSGGGVGAGGSGGTGGAGGGPICAMPASQGGALCSTFGVAMSSPTQVPCPPCAPTPGSANPMCTNGQTARCAYCTGNGQTAEIFFCAGGAWSSSVETGYCADCPAGGGIAPTPGLITNIDNQNCAGAYTGPALGEDGHLAATRLVPSTYPATVGKVRYQIVVTSVCQPYAHRVDVFKASTVVPPADPTVIESFNVPANAQGPDFKIELTLTNPITLTAGEYLFVAVEQKRSGLNYTCVATCGGPNQHTDRNYWSNADTIPYLWATMASFNIKTDFIVEALP